MGAWTELRRWPARLREWFPAPAAAREATAPTATAEPGTAFPRGVPEPDFGVAAPRVGRPGRYKWTFAAVWLFYLIDPVLKVIHSDHSSQWKILNYAVVGAFVVLYGALAYIVYPKQGELGTEVRASAAVAPVLLAMAAIALVASLWINPELAALWVYTGTGTGLSLPLEDRRAYKGVLIVVALMTLCLVVSGNLSDWLVLILPTFFAGLSTIGIRQLAVVIGQLREARETVARLAANEERLRLARDLHDLTGHSLSLITLKAELAQRLLHKARESYQSHEPHEDTASGPVPGLDRALKEVAEIEQVSRQSLADIRKAVSGYRRATLVVELASAYAALEAADITLDADSSVAVAAGDLAPEAEAALAWSLREAVTNVIRHSGATRVAVDLRRTADEAVLTVRNDGRGLAAALSTAGRSDEFGGNGLTGLRERLDAVGGRLVIGGPDGDFRLVAAVPSAAPVAERTADQALDSGSGSDPGADPTSDPTPDSASGGAATPVAIG